MNKKTALIAGATGQVGSYLLQLLLQSEAYDRVISIGRKTVELNHVKLKNVVVDFENLDTLSIVCDDVFCCLGTTIKKAKSKENFKKVDYGYPLALAEKTLANGASTFIVVSSAGASSISSIFYSKVKGEMEDAIKNKSFNCIGIFRPSMLLGPRKEKRLGEQIFKAIMTTMAFVIPAKYKGVQAEKVAMSMVEFAQSGSNGIHVIENDMILK